MLSPQQIIRLTLEDVIIPVCKCKTKAQLQAPEVGAEVRAQDAAVIIGKV